MLDFLPMANEWALIGLGVAFPLTYFAKFTGFYEDSMDMFVKVTLLTVLSIFIWPIMLIVMACFAGHLIQSQIKQIEEMSEEMEELEEELEDKTAEIKLMTASIEA